MGRNAFHAYSTCLSWTHEFLYHYKFVEATVTANPHEQSYKRQQMTSQASLASPHTKVNTVIFLTVTCVCLS